MKNTLRLGIVVFLVVMIGVSRSDDKTDEEFRVKQLARSKSIAESFVIVNDMGTASRPAQMSAKPLLRYTDATRQQDESVLWLWTDRERPMALMAIEYYPKPPHGPRWLYEIVSLSESKIGVKREAIDWKAQRPGAVRNEVPDGPEPSDKPALRLIQARKLRQRFTAHEKTPVEGRIELRPLTNPIYRYRDEESGVVDGAIFAFANGTNPEVLLVLEARQDAGSKSAVWKYGFAQMTGGEVYASLDEREVWSQPEADPPASRDSYVNGWISEE
ncbi:MAG: hypothetical protein JSS49_22275 [Planctomycetes bacterium]|nr:hypothetical protein [Planctomycetota bacterium]